MADKPILFSAPMVRALLAGTKTQTRRDIAGLVPWDLLDDVQWAKTGADLIKYVRIKPGDRLYVREAWKTSSLYDAIAPRDLRRDSPIYFLAHDRLFPVARYRQGMHMPRWASRITLTVTDVRVQRLQEISEADAIAEGVDRESADPPFYYVPSMDPTGAVTGVGVATGPRPAARSYARLWNHINGPGSWDTNPWVAAYSFEVRLRNIDGDAA